MARSRGVLNIYDIDSKLDIHALGHNGAVGTSLVEIWSQATSYSFPSSASTMKVSSDNANDTSAGTGARTVEIVGLDANWNEVNETITLNGTTAVNTVNSYIRINEMLVKSAGSGGKNAGALYTGIGTVTAGVPATIYSVCEIGENASMQAIYSVPDGYDAFIEGYAVSSASQKATEAYIKAREFGEVLAVFQHIHFFQDSVERKFSHPRFIGGPKSDIVIQAKVSATTSEMSGDFELVLVPKL